MWPTILRRAYEKEHIYNELDGRNEKKNPTGLFYLLHQHGPVLVADTDLTSTMGCKNNDDDDDDMNNNCNGKLAQLQGPTLTRIAKRARRE